MSSWINGETGGYLRVVKEGRNWFDTEFPKLLAEKPWVLSDIATVGKRNAATAAKRKAGKMPNITEPEG
jgi:alpha-galactosidase